ncbi:unnamed protein product [Paramecium octaurelia]|uniref:RING-type domain-containing protein n=1 Tax=Paramecium octaurelia TaxID=43137 RepID=A0A8S1Y579_PAROT|nr:unnamed protein product [Paramecium octaurelia]
MQTQNEMIQTPTLLDIKNQIRSRNLFNSIIIKFLFATILLLNLSLQVQFQVNKIMMFIILQTYQFIDLLNYFYHYFQLKSQHVRLKKKRIHIYLLTAFLDSLFITSFLILEKSGYTFYLYSNALLALSVILNLYPLYFNNKMQESIQKLNKTSIIFRLYILICSIFVSLKLDNIINWEWSAVLWPLWVGLFSSIIISIGSLIITFNMVVQYLFEQLTTQKSKIISYIWLTKLSIFATISIGLTSLGYLDYLTKKPNYSKNFIILQYFIIAELIIIMFYSVYFHSQINEYIFSILQDDEPLSTQQQLSAHTQRNNQTLQNLNVLSSRTGVPQVMQKISKAYFSIPNGREKYVRDSIHGSPVIKQSSKGHKRAFSSQGMGTQVFQESDFKIFDKQSCVINQVNTNRTRSQVEKKRSNSQLITIARDESIQNQRLDISQTSNVCIVCYERGPNAVFMNCGHGGTCYQCALDIWKQKMECYLCRVKIVYILKVDLEERFGNLFKVISTTQMIDQFNK